jgi:hypothetical protein
MLAVIYIIAAVLAACPPAPYAAGLQIELKPTLTLAIGSLPVVVQGTIAFIDSCSFSVSNFIMTGPQSAQWFGGVTGNTAGTLISPAVIAPSSVASTQTFALASPITWDFNEIRLFEAKSQSLIGVAKLPPPNNRTAALTTTLNTGPAKSTGTASNNKAFNNGALTLSMSIFFLAVLATSQW